MKETGSDHAVITETADQIRKGKLDGKGKVKWVELIPYDKICPYLPVLREIRGSKTKLSITMFKEISDMAQSLFERHKHFFRFRTQVDCMAYYIGIKILEQIYITRPGFFKSPLSILLESQEEQNKVYDDMKTVKEKFKTDIEKFQEGYVSEEELLKRRNALFSVFSEKKDREKVEIILSEMINEEEAARVKDRVRHRKIYHERAKAKGIGIVEKVDGKT